MSSAEGPEEVGKTQDQYSCHYPGCTVKAFPTRSHLNRHLGIHTGAARRQCPTCGRSFARSDVLTRHRMRAHAFGPPSQGRGRGRSSGETDTREETGNAQEVQSTSTSLPEDSPHNVASNATTTPSSAKRDEHMQSQHDTQDLANLSNLMFGSTYSALGQGTGGLLQAQSGPPYSPQLGLLASESSQNAQWLGDASNPVFAGPSMPDAVLGSASLGSMNDQLWGNLDNTLASMPLSQEFDFGGDFWGIQSGSSYATEPQSNFQPIVDVNHLMTTSTVTSPNATLDWLNLISNDFLPNAERTAAAVATSSERPENAYNSASIIDTRRLVGDNGTPSAWPHTWNPGEAASDLNVRSLNPEQVSGIALLAAAIPTFHNLYVSEQQRAEIIQLVTHCSKGMYADLDTEELPRIFPSSQVLSGCLILYFRQFSPILPIFRPKTFAARSAPPVLILAMASIGAVFSRQYLNDLALALSELTRRLLIYLNERDNRTMFYVPVVQAHLLQSLGGFFSGSRRLYMYAEVARSHLVTATRRMHLLRRAPPVTTQAGATASAVFWEEEERRRLGWAIYHFDSLLSTVINGQPLFSLAEIKVPLPCEEDAWESERSTMPAVASATFPEVIKSLLTSQRLPGPLSPFGYLIIGQSLYRMCLDGHTHQSLTYRPFVTTHEYSLQPAEGGSASAQKLLQRVVDVWSFISIPDSAAFLIVSALSHHTHLHFACPGFLEMVKAAGGKPSTENGSPKDLARRWLSRWIETYPVAARRALVHAAQLLNGCDSNNMHYGPSEVILSFDATLVIWAIYKFGPSDNWRNDTTSALGDFVQQGGQILLPGLGNLASKSLLQFLEAASAKLAPNVWGLSKTFQQVLQLLIQEEKASNG